MREETETQTVDDIKDELSKMYPIEEGYVRVIIGNTENGDLKFKDVPAHSLMTRKGVEEALGITDE